VAPCRKGSVAGLALVAGLTIVSPFGPSSNVSAKSAGSAPATSVRPNNCDPVAIAPYAPAPASVAIPAAPAAHNPACSAAISLVYAEQQPAANLHVSNTSPTPTHPSDEFVSVTAFFSHLESPFITTPVLYSFAIRTGALRASPAERAPHRHAPPGAL